MRIIIGVLIFFVLIEAMMINTKTTNNAMPCKKAGEAAILECGQRFDPQNNGQFGYQCSAIAYQATHACQNVMAAEANQ